MPWLPWICLVHPSRGDKGALCELAVGLAVHDILAISWRSCDLQQSCRNLWYPRLWSKIGMCHILDQIHLLILFLTMTFAVHIVHRQAGLFPRGLPPNKRLSAPCNLVHGSATTQTELGLSFHADKRQQLYEEEPKCLGVRICRGLGVFRCRFAEFTPVKFQQRA